MSEKNNKAKTKSSTSPAQQPVVQKSAKVKRGPTAPKTAADYEKQKGSARALRRQGLVKDWRTTPGAKQMLPPANGVTNAVPDAQ